MGCKIQGKVEGRDERADANGHPFVHTGVAFATWRVVHGEQLAPEAHALFGGHAKRIDESPDFAAAVADGFARLDTKGHGQVFGPLGHALNAMLEHLLARIGRHRRHRRRCRNGKFDGTIDGASVREGYAGGNITSVFVCHLPRSWLGAHASLPR